MQVKGRSALAGVDIAEVFSKIRGKKIEKVVEKVYDYQSVLLQELWEFGSLDTTLDS